MLRPRTPHELAVLEMVETAHTIEMSKLIAAMQLVFECEKKKASSLVYTIVGRLGREGRLTATRIFQPGSSVTRVWVSITNY